MGNENWKENLWTGAQHLSNQYHIPLVRAVDILKKNTKSRASESAYDPIISTESSTPEQIEKFRKENNSPGVP